MKVKIEISRQRLHRLLADYLRSISKDPTPDITVDYVSIRPDIQEMFYVSYEQDHP